MNQDLEHLKLLSIFHYIVAGMTALFSLFPVIHLILGIVMVINPEQLMQNGEAPPEFVGWIFILMAAFFILAGMTMAIFIAFAGRFLAQRRRYLFCMVVAAIECLFMPFGTILGVFTLVVLMRDSVKELFAPNKPMTLDI